MNYIHKFKNLLINEELKKENEILSEFKDEFVKQSEFFQKMISDLQLENQKLKNALSRDNKNVESKEEEEDRKKVYRKPNRQHVEIVPQKNREVEIEEISKIYDTKRQTTTSLDDAHNIFKNYFEELQSATKVEPMQKIIENIKKTRLELLRVTPYENYKRILEDHMSQVLKILKSKNLSDKRVSNYSNKLLSTIDTRILYSPNYTSVSLEMDEINYVESSLEFSGNFTKEYTPFLYDVFLRKFHNYGVVILSLKKLIKSYLFNAFGFHNYIYLNHKKSSDADPYTYYRLVKTEKGNLHWDMDCRAENIANIFISDMLPYLISVFRKMYSDIFHDNIYRQNYTKTNSITEFELEQLILNIFIVSNPRQCCDIFREIIKEHASKNFEEMDKFSMLSDDVIQKERFSVKTNSDCVLGTINVLFDGISIENAVDLLREKYHW